MAVSFPTFYGHHDENARDFMDSLEMTHLMAGCDQEEVKLRAFPLVLKGKARVWYDALAPPSKATWPTLYGAFLNKYGQGDTPENLWKQLLSHHQGSLGDYNTYESKFTNLWERWAASLQGQGGAPNFLKRDKFVEDEESSDESSYGDEESYTSEESSMEVMGLIFQQPQAKGSSMSKEVEVVAKEEPMMEERLRKMLSKDLTKEEEEDYINMFKRYPHLFITDYSMIKGVDVIQHHIDLKPDAKPIAQKLRRLGVVQQEDLLTEVNKLLKAGFIYLVTNSECLNSDKCQVVEKEVVLLGHVISQEGIKVDPSRVQAILDLPPPNSARQVITFVQKVRYMSRFIHLLSQIISPLQQLANQELEDAYTLLFDGAYHRQRNKAAGGFVILNEEKKEFLKKGIQLHLAHSNNEAEYATFKDGLEECKSMGIKRLMVKGDALLIVRHVQGTWACKNSKLLQWLHEVKLLTKDFKAIQIQHISRQHKKEVDNMANSQFEVMVGAIKFKEPLFQGQETMEDILYFLETGECPKHLERVQRHCLVKKALSYRLIGEHLYHKGKDLVLRRVPLVKEIEKILIFPIFAYGPFEKWGIDAIGPLPRTSTGKQYILTATDYMTRWAEAASVARITVADVSKFVLDYICSRFGTPLEILYDTGPSFRADLLDALLENLSIKHVHSTPYYPQCNGLVEKTNDVLCKIITKHVRDRPQDWDKHLTAALWAYRTSFKVSTQFTPYHLVYGQEALSPIEVELESLRVLARETTSSKEKLGQRILDLQRLELDRETATDYYITQANKKREQFNNKVKEKKLEEGMLVMRYDSRLDLSHSKKFLQRWEGPYVIFKKFKNGNYWLQDLSGKIHKYPVNGWKLKEFFQRIQPIKEERQVSLDA
ncbi:hypothetical protein L7F22_057011 [Adiantum nelumboides]|nr:hypothetical protein [Adiantum nelumboides]